MPTPIETLLSIPESSPYGQIVRELLSFYSPEQGTEDDTTSNRALVSFLALGPSIYPELSREQAEEFTNLCESVFKSTVSFCALIACNVNPNANYKGALLRLLLLVLEKISSESIPQTQLAWLYNGAIRDKLEWNGTTITDDTEMTPELGAFLLKHYYGVDI